VWSRASKLDKSMIKSETHKLPSLKVEEKSNAIENA
jgi:hypothetical protein